MTAKCVGVPLWLDDRTVGLCLPCYATARLCSYFSLQQSTNKVTI